jgi:hypothetical protein
VANSASPIGGKIKKRVGGLEKKEETSEENCGDNIRKLFYTVNENNCKKRREFTPKGVHLLNNWEHLK